MVESAEKARHPMPFTWSVSMRSRTSALHGEPGEVHVVLPPTRGVLAVEADAGVYRAVRGRP